MATINLAPGTQYLAAIRRRRRILFGISSIIVLVLLAAIGTLFLLTRTARQDLATAETELAAVERKLVEAGPDVQRITLFEKRLTAVQQLLKTHVHYTPLLKEIERLLPAPTVLTNMKIVTDRNLVEVRGLTPTLDEVAQTLASLATTANRATIFTKADLTATTRQEEKNAEGAPLRVDYTFRAELPFARSVLYSGI